MQVRARVDNNRVAVSGDKKRMCYWFSFIGDEPPLYLQVTDLHKNPDQVKIEAEKFAERHNFEIIKWEGG